MVGYKQGGYLIENLGGVSLTSGSPATVPATFNNPNRKAVLLTGVKISGTEYPDFWLTPTDTENKYDSPLGTFEFSGNSVTFTATAAE